MSHLIGVEGMIDLHIHSHPCLFPRLAVDREVVESAIEAGIAAVMLKCHHESTVSRAYLLDQEFPEIRVYGGIVLNQYVGGINPAAVEAALALGAKEVWMPTVDALHHASVHGARGRYDVQDAGGTTSSTDGISVLQGTELTPEAASVLDLIAERNAILGTAHLSAEEIELLIREAVGRGVKKILLTHPYFKAPNLDLPFIQRMVTLGAIAEFGYCTVSPMWNYATVQQVADSIKSLGAEHCVIVSDAGQRHNPMPAEALRIFAQSLYEKGVSKQELELMMTVNPGRLLDLEVTQSCSSNDREHLQPDQ